MNIEFTVASEVESKDSVLTACCAYAGSPFAFGNIFYIYVQRRINAPTFFTNNNVTCRIVIKEEDSTTQSKNICDFPELYTFWQVIPYSTITIDLKTENEDEEIRRDATEKLLVKNLEILQCVL